jgi:hypothetical protein
VDSRPGAGAGVGSVAGVSSGADSGSRPGAGRLCRGSAHPRRLEGLGSRLRVGALCHRWSASGGGAGASRAGRSRLEVEDTGG